MYRLGLVRLSAGPERRLGVGPPTLKRQPYEQRTHDWQDSDGDTEGRARSMLKSISLRFHAPRPTSWLVVLLLVMAFAALPAVAQDRRSHVISVLKDQAVAIGTITWF
jgi:hypothetical protein